MFFIKHFWKKWKVKEEEIRMTKIENETNKTEGEKQRIEILIAKMYTASKEQFLSMSSTFAHVTLS